MLFQQPAKRGLKHFFNALPHCETSNLASILEGCEVGSLKALGVIGRCRLMHNGRCPEKGPLSNKLKWSATHCQQVRWAGFAAGQGRNRTFSQSYKERLKAASQQQGMYLIAIVVGMVGLTYASVPLYRMFCQATGYGGTVQQGSTVEEKLQKRQQEVDASLEAAAAARNLTISFNADVSDGMNWKFVPTQRSVKINPGQSTLAFYTAHNLSDKAVTGVSTYNVSPQQAGAYFNKIQCFCFEEQKLRPGEKIDMPVFFYIDPEFATDPRMRGIDHLTLSYTFFKVDEEDGAVDNMQSPAVAAAQ